MKRETRQSWGKIKAHRFGQAELEENEVVREQRKQFRVELWLEVAHKKRSSACVSPAGAFRLNVKLCQQKLYRTTLDRALGTSCLGANFPACRKLHRRRHGLPLPAPPQERTRGRTVPGNMATEAGALASQAGRHPPLRPRPTHRLTGSQATCGGGVAGRAGRRLPAGKPGVVGGARCLLGARLRELCCTTSPRQPCPLPHRLLRRASPQRLGAETRGSWGSRHQGNF